MSEQLQGWDHLRHQGLLLDAQRLQVVASSKPSPLPTFFQRDLRKRITANLDSNNTTTSDISGFISFVLQQICEFGGTNGNWQRGPAVSAEWGRVLVTGETIKPRHLWLGTRGAILPVFIDREKRVGIGRGRKVTSQVLQWLRSGTEQLALITNGQQWRLVFAGLDFDAWCEWDTELWLEGGELSEQVTALRTLLQPQLWTPEEENASAPLLQSILNSRKGQAELSKVLGERVRQAVEFLVQSHGEVLKEQCSDIDPADIYRAAVRVVMRMVVILFAESRELLPRDNALYHNSYGIGGLLEELEKTAAQSHGRLTRSWSAWPRVLALFKLIPQGSHHPSLPVRAYGGDLFASGADSQDHLSRTLAVFESACFDHEVLPDDEVHRILDHITRTRIKLRQGRASTWVPAPVDFSDLSSEYIGILYEGLLDFELKTAPDGDPVIFLAVGNQPVLPLSRLEDMDDAEIKNLLEKMKDTSKDDDESTEIAEDTDDEDEIDNDETTVEEEVDVQDDEHEEEGDERQTTRTRAELWARRAVAVGRLVKKPRGRMTPEKQLVYEDAIARKARQLVNRVILPGEWYLVRWGGTRKGAGTFYTRPGLAVPTVRRTLQPLAWTPPVDADGNPETNAPPLEWAPKKPEEILALKVVDPACGSGTFPVAALRYITNALYSSLHHHGRIHEQSGRSVVSLLKDPASSIGTEELLCEELLPCRPDDELFEPRLKAVLRRHVVERCIYGVDIDPLAVELCRLSLWVETMDRTLPFSFLDHKIKCGNSLVGAWFDQFQHYPAMAWKNREGGDKNHSNGVHFEKNARTKLIKEFVNDTLTPDIRDSITDRWQHWETQSESMEQVHDEALCVLERLHKLSIIDAAERAQLYRDELVGSASWQSLKSAMDLWCACWFWPTDQLDCVPLPSSFANPSDETVALTQKLATEKRFFHWELEFPDVFREENSGFNAVLGNPPWENLQPNPEEFFSNIDPLFRTYGNLEKKRCCHAMYEVDAKAEEQWLDYCANFRNLSHWFSFSANPFGDPEGLEGTSSYPLGRGGKDMHRVWRTRRGTNHGYASIEHPFRYQMGRVFTYKLFLEHCHSLLRVGGRMGQIVPNGLYSDSWSQPLRELFPDHCSWEWLFGFENREKIFDIHRSTKFNPIIIEKGGKTAAIRTAFMRRNLEDWERAETFATDYTFERVEQFSPRSKAILEIQSARDLEILEKIYANSVLLGDDSPDGWGIKFKLEFMMNTDAHLFPPRPKWEEKGYRPDEYSRWLLGDWRSIEELWAEMGVQPLPEGDARCAQSPYDTLPISRADIAEGIILSREANAFIREDQIKDIALPLYEGRMIGQFDFRQKGWVSGKGRTAVWREIDWEKKIIDPQYLISESKYRDEIITRYIKDYAKAHTKADVEKERIQLFSENLASSSWWLKCQHRVGFIDVTSATNTRTTYSSLIAGFPCGNSAPLLETKRSESSLSAIMNSFVFDMVARFRCGGLHLNWFVIDESPLPRFPFSSNESIGRNGMALGAPSINLSVLWVQRETDTFLAWREQWCVPNHERLRLYCQLNAIIAEAFCLDRSELEHILRSTDLPCKSVQSSGKNDPKGFWRVDKNKDPELRHTVLTLVAFHDLQEKIKKAGGNRDAGIEAFSNQNDGEGWMLPETLRLADYGLGHDDRAKEHQPVASRLGPRFYDWQLAQTPEESWRECHLHARNLLGKVGYQKLLDQIKRGGEEDTATTCEADVTTPVETEQLGTLFE